jgi:hypothetical protein
LVQLCRPLLPVVHEVVHRCWVQTFRSRQSLIQPWTAPEMGVVLLLAEVK